MRFQITRDEDGKPVHVFTDDGFAQVSRAFDPETDGWMTEQENVGDYPSILSLLHLAEEVRGIFLDNNRLRKENWRLKKEAKQWRSASGFK
jgi:hypothetical protein